MQDTYNLGMKKLITSQTALNPSQLQSHIFSVNHISYLATTFYVLGCQIIQYKYFYPYLYHLPLLYRFYDLVRFIKSSLKPWCMYVLLSVDGEFITITMLKCMQVCSYQCTMVYYLYTVKLLKKIKL